MSTHGAPPSPTRPPSPHDRLFKRMLSDPRHAAGVLRALLPAALAARIDWASLEPVRGSFVGDAATERHTDLLFKARIDGAPTFVALLLEHQSRSDARMPLRLLHYMSHIWTHMQTQAEEAGERMTKIPLVLPVVIHHGAAGWTAPTRLAELYDADPALLEAALPHVPDFVLLIEDLVKVSEEELDAREATDQAKLTLWALGLTAKEAEPEKLPLRAAQLGRVIEEEGADAVRMLIDYLSHKSRGEPVMDALLEAGSDPKVKEITMSMRQKWEAEGEARGLAEGEARGRAQGELEGRARTLLTQLRLKFSELPEGAEARLRGASIEELERWTARILTASSLEELWAED